MTFTSFASDNLVLKCLSLVMIIYSLTEINKRILSMRSLKRKFFIEINRIPSEKIFIMTVSIRRSEEESIASYLCWYPESHRTLEGNARWGVLASNSLKGWGMIVKIDTEIIILWFVHRKGRQHTRNKTMLLFKVVIAFVSEKQKKFNFMSECGSINFLSKLCSSKFL